MGFTIISKFFREHVIEGRLKCSYCQEGISFTKLAEFKQHLKTNHEILEKPTDPLPTPQTASHNAKGSIRFEAACEVCHRKFSSLKGLGTHRRSHRRQSEGSQIQQVQTLPSTQPNEGIEDVRFLQQSEKPPTVLDLLEGRGKFPKKNLINICTICRAGFSAQSKLGS